MDSDSPSPADGKQLGCTIVTGANGSMGIEITKQLVKDGYHVVMACRSVEKGIAAASAAGLENVDVLPLDLSSFHSINRFVEMITEQFHEVSVLVNNAGVISRKFSLTEEGYENTVAVNFIGTAILTEKLIPMMSDGAKIIFTVSLSTIFGHISRRLLYGRRHSFHRIQAYSNSKKALLLYSLRLSKENPHIHVYDADPGIVDTPMVSMGNWLDPITDRFFRPFIKKAAEGAMTAAGLATGTLSGNAVLWKDCRPRKVSRRLMNHPKGEMLYEFIKTLV